MTEDRSEKMVRTSVAVPHWMKKEMERVDANWSAVMREAIMRRLARENETDRMEAVLINQRLMRKAPDGWDSAKVIRSWRDRRR